MADTIDNPFPFLTRAWRVYAASWELREMYLAEERTEEDLTMVRLYLEELADLAEVSAPAILDRHQRTSPHATTMELAMAVIRTMDDPLGY